MDDYAHERRGGLNWIRSQFAAILGITPEGIDWEQHSYGALLHLPIDEGSKHCVMFDHQQIEDSGDQVEWQKKMAAWISEHVKDAQRTPSPRNNPHRCPIKPTPAQLP
ncbi:MAG TPA: hypothetical protein V6C69_06330 [Trichormus sp.]|jgi:hypothetical protein